ncbi:MAG: hypothetical protein H6637_05410 [Ardenticatenales bacterium]|nr:hypothetical protein [Ardenticatenales bacterium]
MRTILQQQLSTLRTMERTAQREAGRIEKVLRELDEGREPEERRKPTPRPTPPRPHILQG